MADTGERALIKELDAIAAKLGDRNVISKKARDDHINNDSVPWERPFIPDLDAEPDPDADRPTLGATVLEHMLVAVANGEPMPKDLTPDERDMWRGLAKEVREIRASGGEIDIPFESPGID